MKAFNISRNKQSTQENDCGFKYKICLDDETNYTTIYITLLMLIVKCCFKLKENCFKKIAKQFENT